jgi:lipoprotein-anchoring transpeptidase ErfK/SrfK
LTLRGIATADVDGAEWIEVSLPAKPNGQTGWVSASDVSVTSTTKEIHIILGEHRLELWDDEDLVFEADVAVGADETPTPVGVYYVTDPVGPFANATGVYGAFAIGISAYSDVLDEFYGGPPQVAIHGTNQPALIGQSVSNGCIRMSNEDVLALADLVDLGTPVVIYDSVATPVDA